MATDASPRGIFVGLATLDVIHRVDRAPAANEKITAAQQFMAAGGPAANAAVTFAALGGSAVLVTALGDGPIARLIRDELEACAVRVVDVAPDLDADAPVSSVAVLQGSGERSVIGGEAAAVRAASPDGEWWDRALQVEIALIDGHHPDLARAAMVAATRSRVPVVVDAGRWKPVMRDIMGGATDVVASADFRLPETSSARETAQALVAAGVPNVVTTSGPEPVQWWSGEDSGAVTVPVTEARDTLGAGDVFHGAYAFATAHGELLPARIAFASRIAAIRCAHIGPRSWLDAVRADRAAPSDQGAS